MKGTILDFLKLAAEKPELAKELVELAAKHDFEFTDEVSDQELDAVAGGTDINALAQIALKESYDSTQSALADYAAKLQSFNEAKAATREYVDGLRDVKADSG
jgi:hypothetical protein